MADVIVIAGAPGSGKHTVTALLRGYLGHPPCVDLGRLREFHLDREWKSATTEEEAMSFEMCTFMILQYLQNGYKNVLVTDLQDFRVRQMPRILKGRDYRIFTLIVDGAELEERIRARTTGFNNVEAALAWNRSIRRREPVHNERRLDTPHATPQQIVEKIHAMLKTPP